MDWFLYINKLIKKKRKDKTPYAEDRSARPDIGPGAGRATIDRCSDSVTTCPQRKQKSDTFIAHALSIAHAIA